MISRVDRGLVAAGRSSRAQDSSASDTMSATSRPTRERSRVSSTAPETRNSKAESGARRQSTLDSWAEPPLGVPRPSFVDAGIERHGAVLNMAPLGTLPSAKLLKQVAAMQGGEAMGRESTRRSGMSNASTPAEVATPEPSAPAVQIQEQPDEMEIDKTDAPETPQEQIKDGNSEGESRPDELPQGAEEAQASVPQSPVPTKAISGLEKSLRIRSDSPIVPPITGPDGKMPFNLEWTDKVVEAAVQEAVDKRRWPTAYGLRTLYDENRSDLDFIRLVEAIYYRYAKDAEWDRFENMLALKKKEGKKDRTGEYYFNGDGSDPPPPRSIVSFVQALSGPPREYQSVYSSAPRRSSSVVTDTPMGGTSFNLSSNAPTPNKEIETIELVKKLKSAHSQLDGASSEEKQGEKPWSGRKEKSSSAPADSFSASKAESGARAESVSSSSPLSSVDEKLIENTGISPARPASSHALADFGRFGVFKTNAPFVSPYASLTNFQAVASSAETLARRQAPPMKRAPKPGPKIHTFSVTSSASTNTSTSTTTSVPTPPPAANANAAAASSSSSTNNLSAINAASDKVTRNNHHPNKKSTSKPMAPIALLAPDTVASTAAPSKYSSAFASKIGTKINAPLPDDVDKRMKLKRSARDKTNSVRGDRSFLRHRLQAAEDNETASEAEESVAVAPPPPKRQKIRLTNNNSRATRQQVVDADDDSELSSPTFLTFRTDGPPTLPSSRAGTPVNPGRATKKGKTGTGSGLRVKTSPMKKKQGTLAGIPRTSGDRDTPIVNGASLQNNSDENDDYCAACGGGGELLCCDGCSQAFHFKCVDPPLSQAALPDSWLCNRCQVKQHGSDNELIIKGIFGPLAANNEAQNPRAFHLPRELRDRYENVRTGPDGEYEETAPPKPTAKKVPGYDEFPDYFRTRDGNKNLITCHACSKTAERPDRMIITCSLCGLHWHLDCIPGAPLAKPPAADRQWQCPAHVTDLLQKIPAMLGPAHRFRKVKGASAIKPILSRGLPNNGHIEIENEPSDEEAEEDLGFHEVLEFGQVLRLPEKGIKLDFIAQAKARKRSYVPELVDSSPKPSPKPTKRRKTFHDYALEEQEAAVLLRGLKERGDPASNGINLLTDALISEMPKPVIHMMAQAQSAGRGPLSEKSRSSMMATIASLQAILAADAARTASAAHQTSTVAAQASTPVQPSTNGASDSSTAAALSSIVTETAPSPSQDRLHIRVADSEQAPTSAERSSFVPEAIPTPSASATPSTSPPTKKLAADSQ